MLAISIGCLVAAVAAVLVRISLGWPDRLAQRGAALGGAAVFTLGLLLWLPSGPLGKEWARRSGTPIDTARPTPPSHASASQGSEPMSVVEGMQLTEHRATGTTSERASQRSSRSAAPARGSARTGRDELGRAPRHRTASCPPRARRDRRGAGALIDQIEQAGLGGRGGAGFPMARKMRTVAGGSGKPIVVVNATEGEPASLKDRTLLETLPHLVLDGAALAARAIGADEAIVCVCESAGVGLRARRAKRSPNASRLPGHWPRIVLAAAPEGYVVGQESALVNHLNGGPAKPTFSPPMPFERGVRRRPTLVNNAETLAHVALIARHGPRWFRELGLEDQPGSTLVTLSGPLAYPGVYEVEFGASLSSLVEAAGGTTRRVRAALFGGYAGTWVDGRAAVPPRALHRPPRAIRRLARRGGCAAALRRGLPCRRDGPRDALACPPERRPVRPVRARPRRARRHARADRARRRTATHAADRVEQLARS